MRLWLEDGSVIGGTGLTASAGGGVVLAVAGSPTPAWPMVQVRAMSLKGLELSGLAGLAMTPDNPRSGGVTIEQHEARPAPLDAESIRLRAPAGVTFALPPRARRVAGSILLPEECREWGDAVVTISAGGKTLVTQRMNARAPYLAFNSAVSGSTLRITLEAGEGGLIQDEVVVQHAVVISGGSR